MPANSFYESETIRKAYTAKKLLDLAFLILDQVADVYRRKGMIFPVICSSTLLCLHRRGALSVTEVAKVLEHPHQTVAQHLNTLDKLGIVKKHADPNDKRRSEYRLTDTGTDQAARLERYNLEAADVFQSLSDDLGIDLGETLDAARDHLRARTMADRFADLFNMEKAS